METQIVKLDSTAENFWLTPYFQAGAYRYGKAMVEELFKKHFEENK